MFRNETDEETEMKTTGESSETVKALSGMLADSYTLYLKTHGFHWNVAGPMFTTLHTLFETQYTELALAVDVIAERIRALGHKAPGSWAEFRRFATVSEEEGSPSAVEMIRALADDHRKVFESARKVFAAAEAAHDPASADLAIRRIDVSEKSIWMLESHLE